MRLLFACIQGLKWPLTEPPAFLARLLAEGAAGPLSGPSSWDQAWLLDGEPFWPLVSRAGLKMGLMNLPGLLPAREIKGFMVCRTSGRDADREWTYPSQLAFDLGDYVQPRQLSAEAPQWRGPLKDTAFAEAAALARLRYEHFRRLCAQHRVEVGALAWSALASARRLFSGDRGRAVLMLAQLDAYLAWLYEEFQPEVLIAAGLGQAGEPGLLTVLAQGKIDPGAWQEAAWPDLLALLMILAGLPSPRPDNIFDGLRRPGERS